MTLSRFDDVHHAWIAQGDARKIHHLCQTDYALKLAQLMDLRGKKCSAGVFHTGNI